MKPHAPEHRDDALGEPAELLQVRSQRQPCKIRRRREASGVPGVGLAQRRAVLAHYRREVGRELLGLERRFDQLHSQSNLEMPFDVACRVGQLGSGSCLLGWGRTVQEPHARVVGDDAERHGLA